MSPLAAALRAIAAIFKRRGSHCSGDPTPPSSILRPCPCGKDPLIRKNIGASELHFGYAESEYAVFCDCGKAGPIGITPEKAAEYWNFLVEYDRI